ncbi:MAG: 4Fe-4S dicluster domain-containing protein [Chloroflexi bacterium]|nr:4Fe-4S dicluster domain-containing protein [Chloroflexota bacterium]
MRHNPADVYEVQPELCAGCLICQLRCSYAFHHEFNPSMARISIAPSGGIYGQGRMVSFTPECTACDLCVKHCGYGALKFRDQS